MIFLHFRGGKIDLEKNPTQARGPARADGFEHPRILGRVHAGDAGVEGFDRESASAGEPVEEAGHDVILHPARTDENGVILVAMRGEVGEFFPHGRGQFRRGQRAARERGGERKTGEAREHGHARFEERKCAGERGDFLRGDGIGLVKLGEVTRGLRVCLNPD